MMTNKEKKLAAALLHYAADTYSNHGCNDLDPSLVSGFTPEENEQLCREHREWNGEPNEGPETLEWIADHSLMEFLASKLEAEAEEESR